MAEHTREASKVFFSGTLKLFERRNSRNSWSLYWAVLGHESLRLFTNHDSFLNGETVSKLITLDAQSCCQAVQQNSHQSFRFKISNDKIIYSFKCDSKDSRQEWMTNLGIVLSATCRNSCFHCSEWNRKENGDIKSEKISSVSSSGSRECQGSTFRTSSTNNPRHSTDQITKSPLKLYDNDQNVFSSFNKTSRSSETDMSSSIELTNSSETNQPLKDENSPQVMKNSFRYNVESDSQDRISTSSLKLFDNQNNRFSTFFKRSSMKRNRLTEFANPIFVLDGEDDDLATDCPEIPKKISKVYDAPLDYDVPTLSKNDSRRGSLKVLTAKNKWTKFQAVIEKNILFLKDSENTEHTSIDLKPNVKFTLLPRRNHDYRFKMTSGTSEYFLKTSNVLQRDSWIKSLTDAARSVCQNSCPRCCTKTAQLSDLNQLATDTTVVPDDEDDVFYVGMDSPVEGIVFCNSFSNPMYESPHDPNDSEETIDEVDHVDNKLSTVRSGYLKTNAIDDTWEQYWATLAGKQLLLHSSEDNINELKTIELTPNVHCKTAKRGSYDFRFTLVASAVESYEFKCSSAHDRREWMTSLERVAGWAQDVNAGSKISEIVTKIRENQSKLEEVIEQQRLEKIREKERQEEMKAQKEQQEQQQKQREQKQEQQQQQNTDESQDIYDDTSTGINSQQLLPSPVPDQAPPPTPPQKRLQHQECSIDVCQDIYDDTSTGNTPEQLLPSPVPEEAPPPTPPQKRLERQQEQMQPQQQNIAGEDTYDDIGGTILQMLLPPTPQLPPPLTPLQKRHQQQTEQNQEEQEMYELLPGEETSQQLLATVPKQQPSLTSPEKRQQTQQAQQDTEDNGGDLYELIPVDNNSLENPQEIKQVEEELYEIIPADNVQQPQQRGNKKEKKNQEKKAKKEKQKKIVPEIKQPKRDKKERKQEQEEKKQENKTKRRKQEKAKEQDVKKHDEQRNDALVKHRTEDIILYKKPENSFEEKNETPYNSWNFEQNLQVLQEAKPEEYSSTEEKDVKKKEECDVTKERKAETICSRNETLVETNVPSEVQDVERFLTQVLGKLGNLPDEVNKERLELSQRLQKFLNPPDKKDTKRKPPPPTPVVPVEEKFDETDEGGETYDDVVKEDVGGEEMYDDVNPGVQNQDTEVQENYEDVASPQTADSRSEEVYDDVVAEGSTSTSKTRSSSRMSNSSGTFDTKDVGEQKKVSDFTDKIYEGYLDKYRTKGRFTPLASKWQRRYCVLTPLALYYYEKKEDKKQKGQILLPAGDHTLRQGCPSFPEVKDSKLCFELGNSDRCFLFKVNKESEVIVWVKHIQAALLTDLSDEQSKIMRQNSISMRNHDEDDDEDLYEAVDTFQNAQPSSSNDTGPITEEMYELTDQFSEVKESSGASAEAPALPSRSKAPSSDEPPPPEDEEEFEEIDDDMEDYQLPDANAPKPGTGKEEEKPPPLVSRKNPQAPKRPNSSQEAPHLPRRAGEKPTPGPPPDLPTRTTPPTAKKVPPELPTRTTPTLTKKNQNATSEDSKPSPPPTEPEVKTKSKVAASTPIASKPLKGEQFDYAKVYVAMWNCAADDEDDLAFSRGNYLYIREKIPNSDWWVASLMDIPDIQVGLVPRNYIMPAYEM